MRLNISTKLTLELKARRTTNSTETKLFVFGKMDRSLILLYHPQSDLSVASSFQHSFSTISNFSAVSWAR